MALVKILADGSSLLRNWVGLPPGKPRFPSPAREEWINPLTHDHDACRRPITLLKTILVLIFALLLPSLPVRGTESVSLPASAENRFLFVVDTSFSMRRLDNASREVIFELVHSGLHQQMRMGDTFSIWTFNAQPYVGKYPLEVWDPRKNLQLAEAAARFVKAQRYGGQSRLGPLFKKLSQVISDVQDVNIFILSDGDTPMEGTPFDKSINATYRINVGKMRTAKKPFLTTLVAQAGQITHWSVTIGDQHFRIPAAPTPEPIVPTISAAPTSTAPEVRAIAPANQPQPTVPITAAPALPGSFASPQDSPESTLPETVQSTDRVATLSRAPGIARDLEKPSLTLDTNQPSPALIVLAPSSGKEALPEPKPAVPEPPLPLPPPQPAAASIKVDPPAKPILPAANEPKTTEPIALPLAVPELPPVIASREAPAATPSLKVSTEAPPPKPAPARSPEPYPPAPGQAPADLVVAARALPPTDQPSLPDPKAPPASVAAVVLIEPAGNPRSLLLAGGLLLVAALGLGRLALRRLRPAPERSLISQSLDQR